jgi:hypothetical protein
MALSVFYKYLSKNSLCNSLKKAFENSSSNEQSWNYIRSSQQCSKMDHFLSTAFHINDFARFFWSHMKWLNRLFYSSWKALLVERIVFWYTINLPEQMLFFVSLYSRSENLLLRSITIVILSFKSKMTTCSGLLPSWREIFSLSFRSKPMFAKYFILQFLRCITRRIDCFN